MANDVRTEDTARSNVPAGALDLEVGRTYEVAAPFVRCTYSHDDGDGYSSAVGWKPGVEWEDCGYYGDDSRAVAHGVGLVSYTIVSLHSPRPFPTRVFYTRRWRDPDGREFGKNKLLIATTGAFKRRIRRYLPGGMSEYSTWLVRDLTKEEQRALLHSGYPDFAEFQNAGANDGAHPSQSNAGADTND